MKLICSLFITFLKIGAFTFGGGYAMIALLENEFVEKKKWLEKSEFLDMVAVAESTPGPVAINAFLSGVRPCVVAMILATALSMALSTLFGLTDLQAGFAPDLRSIAVFIMLGATHLICKIIRKTAPSPILMILFSAGLGILFWCIF